MTDPQPLLECRGLVCGYGDDTPILKGIDLVIGRGEIVALLGGSGCGKSTLLRCITGLLPPRSGEVLLFGESLYDLEQHIGQQNDVQSQNREVVDRLMKIVERAREDLGDALTKRDGKNLRPAGE